MHWPAPTNEDLYLRVRRWNQPGAAAATTAPPSIAGAGEGGGGGDRDGAGAGDRNEEEEVEAGQEKVEVEAGQEKVEVEAGQQKVEVEAGQQKGADFGPEHLVCVPGGLRPSACLALLREAVEAVRHA